MNKKEKTLPLEPRDIERLKEQYGENFFDTFGRGIFDIKFTTIIAFSLILGIFFVITVSIATFIEADIAPLIMIVVVLAPLVFLFFQSADRIKRYKLMQTVIAQNAKRRIVGRASSQSIIDSKGGFSNYWEVKTDDGTYHFAALNCKRGDVVRVDFVTVGSENVVLSIKTMTPIANA